MVDAAQDLPDETEKSSMEFQSQRRLKIKHRELSEPSLVGHHAQPMEPEPSSEFRASDQLLQFSQNTPTAQERQPIEPENDSPVSRQMSFGKSAANLKPFRHETNKRLRLRER
jgi:hypothetical protein